MPDNRFSKPDPDVPGGYLLTPAGTLLIFSNAIHDPDAGDQGKDAAKLLIASVLDAAATNGCTRTEITETLLLGDWGMTALDAQTRADLLEIIDDRSGAKATLITSQLPIEHWHAWVGDATIADAILDRLMQHHHRCTLSGESLRQSKRTLRKGKSEPSS